MSFESEFEAKAQQLANAVVSPAKLAELLGKWVSERYPERVRQALWVTVAGDRDQGLEVRALSRKVGRLQSLRASALLGRDTWGGGLFTDVWEGEVGPRRVVASVGLGAVRPYTGGAWQAVAAASIRF